MSVIQKIILALGAIVLIAVLYVNPVKYGYSSSNFFQDPATGQLTKTIIRVDVGATAMRGIAVLGATAALWAIAGKKKTD